MNKNLKRVIVEFLLSVIFVLGIVWYYFGLLCALSVCIFISSLVVVYRIVKENVVDVKAEK